MAKPVEKQRSAPDGLGAGDLVFIHCSMIIQAMIRNMGFGIRQMQV
jgi:hypothetical protein